MFDVSLRQRDEVSVATEVVKRVEGKRCRLEGSTKRSQAANVERE